jgi:hypothetical protein
VKEVDDPLVMKGLYRFSYEYARSINESPGQRTIDTDMAMAMLNILLKSRWALLPRFLEHLQSKKVKVINRDQWNSLFEFSNTILPDMSNYDENDAWPLLLDEFVEDVREGDAMAL